MLKKWYREWRYLRRFGPKYSIINISPVVVEAVYDSNWELSAYQISLEIKLKCQKMDDLRSMMLHCKDMHLTIVPLNIKGRTLSYPLTYSNGEPSWRFISSKPIDADYTLTVFSEVKPKLGDKVRCDNIHIGTVNINNIQRQLTAKPFTVSVEWSKTEIQDSHKEGSQS